MEILIPLLVALVVIAAIVMVSRRSRVRPPERPGVFPAAGPAGGPSVVLDIGDVDPEEPSVQRLVDEVGSRALAADPTLVAVEVLNREGKLLGRVERPAAGSGRDVELPRELHEPHRRRPHVPRPVAGERPPSPAMQPARESGEVPGRVLAERFDLPPGVRDEVRDPDDPIELVRAILAVGGRAPEVRGDVVVAGEAAVVVVPSDAQRTTEALNHAYLRFQESGARHGIVLTMGWVDPSEVRRREALAPALRYVGADAIQRMADAVALSADPVVFAAGPPVVR